MVGVLHPTCRNNEGNSLGRHLELSGRQTAFALKKRRGKQVMRRALAPNTRASGRSLG